MNIKKLIRCIESCQNQYNDTYSSAKHTLLTKSQLDCPTSKRADIIMNTFKKAITKITKILHIHTAKVHFLILFELTIANTNVNNTYKIEAIDCSA